MSFGPCNSPLQYQIFRVIPWKIIIMFKMMQVRDSHHQVAHNNISKAQAKQKKYYDLKHDVHQVFLAIECLCVLLIFKSSCIGLSSWLLDVLKKCQE